MASNKWINEYVCPVCGKEFIASHADLWRYRIGSAVYCSWTCYRKGQRLAEEKLKRSKRKNESYIKN